MPERIRKAPGAGATAISESSALRAGYTSLPMPAPKPPRETGYKPPAATSAGEMGGAQDDPNIEIIVGPDGKVVRRRRS